MTLRPEQLVAVSVYGHDTGRASGGGEAKLMRRQGFVEFGRMPVVWRRSADVARWRGGSYPTRVTGGSRCSPRREPPSVLPHLQPSVVSGQPVHPLADILDLLDRAARRHDARAGEHDAPDRPRGFQVALDDRADLTHVVWRLPSGEAGPRQTLRVWRPVGLAVWSDASSVQMRRPSRCTNGNDRRLESLRHASHSSLSTVPFAQYLSASTTAAQSSTGSGGTRRPFGIRRSRQPGGFSRQ